MNESLVKVSLRQKAVYVASLPEASITAAPSADTVLLIANLAKLGYATAEPLRQALAGTTSAFQAQLLGVMREVTGIDKNWTPLVKGWDKPTGEGPLDHLVTWLTTVFQGKGTRLPCGHIIGLS